MEQELYVKEMPKSCRDCLYSEPNYRFWNDIITCKFQVGDIASIINCPLKSLHEYKKELVAKVLESVKNEASKDGFYDEDGNKIITYHINNYILDQIQKEFEDGE